MTNLDRRIAGLTCAEVLADLSPFIDGELSDARVGAVRAHLGECRECDRFGALVATVLERLRSGEPLPMSDPLRERVRARVLRAVGQ